MHTWENTYAHVCTDDTKAIIGHNAGTIEKLKEMAFLHWCTLSPKKSFGLIKGLNGVIEVRNHIKSLTLKSKPF